MASSSSDEEGEVLKCICHDEGVTDTIVRPVTEITWASFLKSVGVWKDLVGSRSEIARNFVDQLFKCYLCKN